MAGNARNDHDRRPALEWVVGVASAVAVCGIVAFLAYEALFGDARPPDIAASVDRVESVEGGTLVVVAVSNRGDQAAAEVVVEATLEGIPDARPREIRFDYIASHGVRRGAFMMESLAVDAEDVRLRVHGFVEP